MCDEVLDLTMQRRMDAKDELIAELLTACLNASGAYHALEVAGLDKELPRYQHCADYLHWVIGKAQGGIT